MRCVAGVMRCVAGVCVVCTLSPSLCPTSSAVHPVSVLVLHPREIQILRSHTVRKRSLQNRYDRNCQRTGYGKACQENRSMDKKIRINHRITPKRTLERWCSRNNAVYNTQEKTQNTHPLRRLFFQIDFLDMNDAPYGNLMSSLTRAHEKAQTKPCSLALWGPDMATKNMTRRKRGLYQPSSRGVSAP